MGRCPDVSLLSISALDAGYDELQVLEDVDIEVGDGEHVTIVGPNGAGKSTVLKTIFGFATYMAGSIRLRGVDLTTLAPEEIVYEGIGYVPQTENVFPTLTVLENLEMGAYVKDDVGEGQYREVYDRFPILEERIEQRAGTLSGGQRQMLAMGQALMLDPELLLLDEPSAGLAPELVTDTLDKIDEINAAGTAVLMVEQNATEALRRCDRGYVLAQGKNYFEGPGAALLDNDEVRRRFLGG